MKCALRTPNLSLEPRVCVSLHVNERENVTCEVCCSHPPVGCSRLQSAVNDFTTTKKILQSVTSEQLSEEAALRVALFCDAAHATSSEVLDFDEFYELHQESFHFHHDVLDEDNDECHF